MIESITEPLALEDVERHFVEQLHATDEMTRAATLNLICRARDREDAAVMADLLAELAQRHPGRIFLLVPPAAGAGGADGEWVARILVSRREETSRTLCHEIIQLESRDAAFAGVATALTPLLKGDLPVFLWWRGENPIHNADFDRVAELADRILIDSQELALQPEQFLGLARLQHRRHGDGITDLTWTRLTPWRQLLIQAFDTREGIEQLQHLSSVTFSSCCSQPALNSGAILLAGWLAACLGWQPGQVENSTHLRMATSTGRSVLLGFETTQHPWKAMLHAVVVRSLDDELVVSLVNTNDKISLVLQQHGKLLGQSAGGYPLLAEAEVLREELDILEADHLFQQALDHGVAILHALGVKEQL